MIKCRNVRCEGASIKGGLCSPCLEHQELLKQRRKEAAQRDQDYQATARKLRKEESDQHYEELRLARAKKRLEIGLLEESGRRISKEERQLINQKEQQEARAADYRAMMRFDAGLLSGYQIGGNYCVYIILDESRSMVKIGYANNLSNRISAIKNSAIQVGIKPRLLPLAVIDQLPDVLSARAVERELHKVFKPLRTVGEWFTYNDNLQRGIEKVIINCISLNTNPQQCTPHGPFITCPDGCDECAGYTPNGKTIFHGTQADVDASTDGLLIAGRVFDRFTSCSRFSDLHWGCSYKDDADVPVQD